MSQSSQIIFRRKVKRGDAKTTLQITKMARREHGNKVIWAFIAFIKKKILGHRLKESLTFQLSVAIANPLTLLRYPLRIDAAFTDKDLGILIGFSRITGYNNTKSLLVPITLQPRNSYTLDINWCN